MELIKTKRSLPTSFSLANKSARININDRTQYKCKNFELDEDQIFHPDVLLLLTQHTWNLYRISHVYNIKYTKVNLKNYAVLIKQALVKYLVDDRTNVSITTKFTELPNLKKNTNSSSICIEVFLAKDDAKPSLKYKGIILSWGDTNNNRILTQFPMLLCVGLVGITNIVHKTLTNIFDTVIYHLRLSQDDLFWLSAMLSDFRGKSTVTYNFNWRNNKSKQPLVVSFPSELIQTLWKKIHLSNSKVINYKEVYKFHEVLQKQFALNFGIQFSMMKLGKIVLNNTMISSDGKITIKSEDAITEILCFIKDISLLIDINNLEMREQYHINDVSS